ncbi:terminase small subunit [Akkermansia muciniphila]|jgi:hypothetical protein|uniref:terminase small subunit n=1 Tax=Akkermansia muciniphila TaxID=239935 RepID=UPI001BFF494A|nr:terminase small subunit [Akkermansia muciniphila]MBT8793599.1 hypothetical protein [Akkermansia muciniphila]
MPKRDKTSIATEKKKEFARLLVESKLSKADAYRKAYKRKDMSNDAASKAASRLSKDGEILRMIDELNAQLDRSAIATKQECLEFLTAVLRTPIGQVGEDSPLCQEIAYTDSGMRKKMPGKIEAVRELSKLAGYNEPEKLEVGGLSQIAEVLAGTKQDPLVRPDNGNPAPIEFDGIETVQEDKERRPGVLDGVGNEPLV